MRAHLVAGTALLLCGCMAPLKGSDRVADADAAFVAKCTFVKDVTGGAAFGSRTGVRVGLTQAMDDARADAATAGATHIVWEKVTSPDVSSVSGKAYRCGHGG